MSFEAWMINRDERPAVQFEGTFSNEYVGGLMREFIEEGFDIEPLGISGARVVFTRHLDGRAWVYREFEPVSGSDA